MAPTSLADSDPFVDPVDTVSDHEYAEAWTLPVGRSASLTLATDSLIVLGVQNLCYLLHQIQELMIEQMRISRDERRAIAVAFYLLVWNPNATVAVRT